VVEPSGLPRPVPIWVGGRTRRSLRRALALGDAPMPFGGQLDDLTALLADERITQARREYAATHGEPLQMILAPEPPLDPLGDPAGTIELLARDVALGATGFCLRFVHESMAQHCEQMAALMAVAPHLSP
jgi:hypothetical protein